MSEADLGWEVDDPKEEKGIIVGCTQEQEWLLPWWWMNYRCANNYPVAFINFGDMSENAIAWCKKRGTLINFTTNFDFIKKREDVEAHLSENWTKINPRIWELRIIWFQKPFTFLKTPFKKTIWLDLDCQVRNSLDPIFDEYLEQADVAISQECEEDQIANRKKQLLLPGEVMFNCGVVAFKHGSELILEWTKQIRENNHLYFADQQLFSHLISKHNWQISNLPLIYNWPAFYGINAEATILHWWGPLKTDIFLQINTLQKNYFINLSLDNDTPS